VKIAIFTAGFPHLHPLTNEELGKYLGGGVEVVAFRIAQKLVKRGHEVTVFTTSATGKNQIEDYGTIKICRYKANFWISRAPISLKFIVLPFLLKEKFDIIHAQLGNLPAPLAGVVYGKIKGIPTVLTYHLDYETREGFKKIMKFVSVKIANKILIPLTLHLADVITSVSHTFVPSSKLLPRYLEKLVVIPNGADSRCVDDKNIQKKKKDKKIILFVGSLVKRKNPDKLMHAFSMMSEHNCSNNIKLVYIGDGPMKDELIKLAKKLGLDSKVEIKGFVSEEKKWEYYKFAYVFSLPSSDECFPLSILEAMSCGIPVVVSNIPAFREYVYDGKNGIMVDPENIKEFSETLKHIVMNPKLAKKIGRIAKRIAEKYSWDNIVDRYEQLYLQLIEGKKDGKSS